MLMETERSESPAQTSINSSISNSPATTSSSIDPNSLTNNSTAPDALLWQFYLCHASKTITASSTDPAHTRMWAKTVPAIAFSSPVVSHALMAFSAFCLGSESKHRSKGLARGLRATAERHYYQAVKLLRNSLAMVDQEQDFGNADEMLACGMVLIPCGLALVRPGDEEGGSLELGEWVWHLRGWRIVGESIYGNHGNGKVDSKGRLIPYPQPGIPDRVDVTGPKIRRRRSCSEASMPFLDLVRRSWPDAVDKLKVEIYSRSGYDGSANITTYLSAITALEYVVDYILDFPVTNLFRAIFIWPILISPEFIELLTSNDELALAIYAHWLVLTMAVEDFWWLEGFGSGQIERLVRRAVGMGFWNTELMDWPVEMLGKWRAVLRMR
jgi:hypothetical protein